MDPIVVRLVKELEPFAPAGWRDECESAPLRHSTEVWPLFAIWLLRECVPKKQSEEHTERVALLYEKRLRGDEPSKKAWRAAADAAGDAAAYDAAADAAAYAAAAAVAAVAAVAAAVAAVAVAAAAAADAADADAYAAYAYAYAAAAAARKAAREAQAAALLKILNGEWVL